jgi:DNA-binding winged helix-turn-helix (wHTH) protein
MSADSSKSSAIDYYFGPYRFDGRRRSLYKDGELIPVTPKAADTLVALIERAGRVVDKDELLHAVWGEIVVGDDTLAQNISTLRRVLGDDASRPRFIATVPRYGYRFVADVRATPATPLDRPGDQSVVRDSASAIRKSRVRVLALLGVGAAIAVITALVVPHLPSVVQRLSTQEPPRAFAEFTITEPEHYRFAASGGILALSPNGEYLAFVALDASGSPSLWLRPLASAVARPVDGTEGAAHPFWSPDSRTIAFFADRHLKEVDVMSAVVRVVASLSSPRALGGTWSRTGQILFSVPDDGMYLVPASGGLPARLVPGPDSECAGCATWPYFLPDGRQFLYTVAVANTSTSGIYVGEIGNPHGRRLLDAVSSSTYMSPGFLHSHVREPCICSGSTRAICG